MTDKFEIQSLTYSIEGKNLVTDISLEFSAGYLHGILGPNGSGKSTLLKTMAGIWIPSSGDVYWQGESLLSQSRQFISRTISLVPQHPQIHFDFLAEDVVAMGKYPHERRYWTALDERDLQYVLTVVDAWHLRKRKVNSLSHGERQRIYIARALITESPILLLDEPTASLDIRHQIEIWQLLQQVSEKGKIVIVTTHDLLIAERYCHQISVLNQGSCVSTGTFFDVMSAELLGRVFGIQEEPNTRRKSYII